MRFVLLCLTLVATGAGVHPPFLIMLDGIGPTNNQSSDHPERQWAASRNWTHIIAVDAKWQVLQEQLVEARKIGWTPILTSNSNLEELKRAAWYKNTSVPDNAEAVRRNFDAAQSAGGAFIWEFMVEDDSSGTGFSFDLLQAAHKAPHPAGLSSTEALSLWRTYMQATMNATQEAIKQAGATTPLLVAKFGFPSNAHSIAAAGADVVMAERTNDDTGMLPVGVTFLRGAAQQFNKTWGVDFSLWWGVISGCVEDLPASFHKRALFLSYMAGAALMEVEGCGWVRNGKPLPIADAVDALGHFTETVPPDKRGSPEILAAVVLPSSDGWNERPSWSSETFGWNFAKLRAGSKRGVRGTDGLFSAMYPGVERFSFFAFPFGQFANNLDPPASPFSLSSITAKYAPDPDDVYHADAPIPFGKYSDRIAASNDLKQHSLDPSPFRPMADTAFGDIWDVIVNDNEQTSLQLEVLSYYKMLVWSGDHSVSQSSFSVLKAYVSKGGILVWPAGIASNMFTSLTGLTFSGELLAARAWSTEGSSTVEHEALLFANASLSASGTKVLVSSQPEGFPLVVSFQPPGSLGRVITTTIPYFEGGSSNLAGPVMKVLADVVASIQTVSIDGLPLHFSSSQTEEGHKFITLANHAGAPWEGEVSVTMPNGKLCRFPAHVDKFDVQVSQVEPDCQHRVITD